MRFMLFTVAVLEAAQLSQAVYLQQASQDMIDTPDANLLSQVNAFASSEVGNSNLVEALSKVITSLGDNTPAKAADAPQDANKDEPKEKKKSAPAKKSGEAGTNIAITTATDQHINIFVPEDPDGKVIVKKTDGVKIVESDSDKADKNADIKKAVGDKIRGKLVKKAMNDTESDSSSGDSDAGDKSIARAAKKIKKAKGKSDKMNKALNEAASHKSKKGHHNHHQHAQIGSVQMTEEEILSLGMAQVGSESEAESESDSDSGYDCSLAQIDSEADSEAASESDSESGYDCSLAQVDADNRAMTGLDEQDVLELAQVETPHASVKLTPQVHVQVTRVGHGSK